MKYLWMSLAYALLPVIWTGFIACKLLLLMDDGQSISDATKEWLSGWREFAGRGIV